MTLREGSPKLAAGTGGAETSGGDPLEGVLLGGVYRVGRRVGAGAMGGIYEARNIRLDKRVAIKVMARELSANPASLARFHREAEITSRLGHPHIITVFDFGTSDSGAPYLVMELLDGEDLARRLHRRGRLPLPLATRVVRQVGSALAETHASGVIHRDLKPANVFLVKAKGDDDFAKVLDFGTSKVRAAASALTGASTLMGTPLYMAPEQAEGRVDELDAATDQWALACIAYEMLAGRAPFVGDDVSAILYQVVHREPPPLGPLAAAPLPANVEPVIRRALCKRPGARFPSVTAFARAFEAAAAGLPLPPETADDARPSAPALAAAAAEASSPTLAAGARPTPARISGAATAQPTQRWQRQRRRRAPLAAAVVATAAAIGVAGAVWLGPSRWRSVPAKPAAAAAESSATAARAATAATTPEPAAPSEVPAPPPVMAPAAAEALAAAALATASEGAQAAAAALAPLARATTRSATDRETTAPADRAARTTAHGARTAAGAPRRTARRPAAAPAADATDPAPPARPDSETAAPAAPSPAPVGPTKRRLIKQL